MPSKSKKNKSKAVFEAEQKAKEEKEERLRAEEEKEKQCQLQRAEDEKKEKIRRQLQEEKFQEDQDKMSKIKCERHQRFCNAMKLFDDEREWQIFISCEDFVGANFDNTSFHCFLFENGEMHNDALAEECVQDVCNFCVDVSRIMENLIIERLYLKSTSQSTQDSETKSEEFLSKCFKLLQAKLNKVTTKYLKGKKNNLLTVEEGKASFGIEFHEAIKDTSEQSTLRRKTILPTGQYCLYSRNGCHIRVVAIPFYKLKETCYEKDPLIIGNTLYQIDVLEVPPKPRRVERWTINSNERYNQEDSNNSNSSKIECHIHIPDYIVPSNSLSIMRQDNNSIWSLDGVSDVRIDFEQNNVFFNLSKRKNIVAIVQPRIEDVNYKRWSIGPIREPCAIDITNTDKIHAVEILLETPRFGVQIQVIGTYCYLVKPEINQLKDLIRKPHTPEKLLSILSQRGIHLIPSESDLNFRKKSLQIEDRFCEDMSLLCFAFDIQSSSHNVDLERSKAMYNIKESDAFTGGRDIFPMYQILMEYEETCDKVSCSIIIDPSGIAYEKNKGLSSLYPLFALESFCSPETLERVKLSSPCTNHTLERLLKLVNIISCCDNESAV